ncbi:MAG: 4a-hydroxytetrahydrobiopterin dehydratase [Planctomycetota bacterium]
MSASPSIDWSARTCTACEGGVPPQTPDAIAKFCQNHPGWNADESGRWIRRKLNMRTFVKAVDMINAVSTLAESEQHHPDLHLTGYRHLTIDLTTHAIGGVSDNDFILAAKIDQLLDQLESSGASK